MGGRRAGQGRGCGEGAPAAPSGEAAVVQFLSGVPRTARSSEFSFFFFFQEQKLHFLVKSHFEMAAAN